MGWRKGRKVILRPSDRRLKSSFSSEILPLRIQWGELCNFLMDLHFSDKVLIIIPGRESLAGALLSASSPHPLLTNLVSFPQLVCCGPCCLVMDGRFGTGWNMNDGDVTNGNVGMFPDP